MKRGNCRGCRAEIVWIQTKDGKNMPCDPKPVPYWEKAGAKGKVVTLSGQVISCEFVGDVDKATGIGYISHFSTCPQARKFKSK